MRLGVLTGLALTVLALACGGAPPPPEPVVTQAPSLFLQASFAFDQRVGDSWQPWDRREPAQTEQLRLWVNAEWADEVWLYAVLSTQDATYQRVARRAPGDSAVTLFPEGLNLAREGAPWQLVQVLASAMPVPALESMDDAEVRCAYVNAPDLFSDDRCVALEGIRGVGKPRVRSPLGNADRYELGTMTLADRSLPSWTMEHERAGAVSVDFMLRR